jgi:hypothetical protein
VIVEFLLNSLRRQNSRQPASTAGSQTNPAERKPLPYWLEADATLWAAEIVIVPLIAWALPLLAFTGGVRLDGLDVQVTPAGSPEHPSITSPA